jgi:YHS domain-containing protein
MAEIVQMRRAAERVDWPAADAETQAPATVEAPATAVDPVCGMTVKVEGAAHLHEHGGETFYFCCGGCRTKFSEAPEQFLAA